MKIKYIIGAIAILAVLGIGILLASNSGNLQGMLIKQYKKTFENTVRINNVKQGIEMGDQDPLKPLGGTLQR